MKNKDKIISFVGFAVAVIWIFGIAFLLYKNGNEWLAKRFSLSGFVIYSWFHFYTCCKLGQMNPYFTKWDSPLGYLIVKYIFFIINILLTIGVCCYWVFDNL